MQIIYGQDKIKKSKKAIIATVGIFDGVHLGHQYLLKKVIKQAKCLKAKSAVFTFDPHPLMIADPSRKPQLLIFLRHRLRLIASFKIDLCVVLKFNHTLANMQPGKFIKKILVDNFKLKELLVGEHFSFGQGKGGDIDLLKELGRKYNFKVKEVKKIKAGKEFISSTKIRRLITRGQLNLASKLLGRPVSILGTVTKGFSLGRKLGFPTANIDPHHEVLPPFGVYAVKIKIDNKWYQGILNIGKRPTFFKDAAPTIETYLFDFKKNIYGKDIEVIFLKKIRPEEQFKNPQHLIQQIKNDIKIAKKYFPPPNFPA